MIKTCNTCKQPKNILEFWKQEQNKDGYEHSCKQCRMSTAYERRRAKRIANGLKVKFPTIASRELLAEGMKFCPGCKQILPVVDFSTMKVRSGVASHCKECSKKFQQERNSLPEYVEKRKLVYKRNKEKQLNANLIREFNITLEQYNKKLTEQNGGCFICGKTPEQNGKRLAVDHNHVTGKNRGLLCSSCNICIGFIEKNSLDIERVKEYLVQHNLDINNKHNSIQSG